MSSVLSVDAEQTFAALGDPTRTAIVARLCRGSASVGELAQPFGMTLTGFLKHLRILEEAGVVHTMKVGRVRRCELNGTRLAQAATWLEQRRELWERRIDRLERYARETGE